MLTLSYRKNLVLLFRFWILTLVKQSFDLRREKLAGDLGEEGVEEEDTLRKERGLLFLVGVTSPEVLH